MMNRIEAFRETWLIYDILLIEKRSGIFIITVLILSPHDFQFH